MPNRNSKTVREGNQKADFFFFWNASSASWAVLAIPIVDLGGVLERLGGGWNDLDAILGVS